MDTLLEGYYDSMNGFRFDLSSIPGCSNQKFGNGFKLNQHMIEPDSDPDLILTPSGDLSPSTGTCSEGDNSDDGEFSNAVFKYISEILMEEDLDGNTGELQNRLALEAAEKSFYDVLGQSYPPSDGFDLIRDQTGFESFPAQTSLVSPPGNTLFAHSEIQSVAKFTEGVEEACKFLPNFNCLSLNLETNPLVLKEKTRVVVGEVEKDGNCNSSDGSRAKKNHQREDSFDSEEGRSNKQSAVYSDDFEQSDLVDEVLLCNPVSEESASCFLSEASQNGSGKKLVNNGQLKEPNGRTLRGKKRVNKKEVVDLLTLLTQCAQAVSSYDNRIANELVKKIRQHSSPWGDGNQRLAHYFADALEVRMGNTQAPKYVYHVGTRTSAADIFKAYHLYISACPFKIMSNYFANRTIIKRAQKATSLHVIDFGILYGFQWPCLIKRLSERPDGPPKLRITGIELPQPGFRPAERVEETGRRLEKYCERFNVQFEYHAISQKWETIKYEDLKIDKAEMTVVNCLYRLKGLPDETLVVNSPRDAVLKMIRKIKPDVFVHGVMNGSHNAPFFLTRFREALFHFSALFDMFEANVPRENRERMLFENAIFARDTMNVIACEGWERVERPETYKQWQVRNLKVGFRQLPLDKEIVMRVKRQVKSKYHKDFVVDEDGQWMLQGWKGRIIYSVTCWEPA